MYIKNNVMEKINECTCTSPYWCADENQMEPGYTCDYCQQQESNEHVISFITSVNKPSTVSDSYNESYDDLPF